MEIKNTFQVAASLKKAWVILLDVPRITPCMPGAELTEMINDKSYKGNAKLRVGPVQLTFSGQAEITNLDQENFTATVHAKGNDIKGRGAAEADVVFALYDEAGQTRVDVTTTLNLTGSVAQYGRASGLIDAIAGQIISDFAKNLETEITGDSEVSDGGSNENSVNEELSKPINLESRPKNSLSVISLLFRAILSMIRGKR